MLYTKYACTHLKHSYIDAGLQLSTCVTVYVVISNIATFNLAIDGLSSVNDQLCGL